MLRLISAFSILVTVTARTVTVHVTSDENVPSGQGVAPVSVVQQAPPRVDPVGGAGFSGSDAGISQRAPGAQGNLAPGMGGGFIMPGPATSVGSERNGNVGPNGNAGQGLVGNVGQRIDGVVDSASPGIDAGLPAL